MRRLFVSLVVAGGFAMTAQTDEGMWLLNDAPRKALQDRYKFELTDAWLDRAMKASVRFNNGGSGGFVSGDGLIVTNHHIAADALQKLSTREHDLFRNGFLARNRVEELRCPDLELNVLQEIVDVTVRVNAAAKPAMTPEQASTARKSAMSEIEKESLEATKLRSDVVTLYQGGLYHLYRYRKYTDVRLVFAPEQVIAFFGGDTDNFEFPRYNLDVAFFRAYENGEPVKSPRFFPWSQTDPLEDDLVFVVGHPGTTNRLETLAKLMHRRDVTLPYALNRLRTMEAALEQYSARGPEQRRQAATDLHRVANARKAISGQYQGLLDPKILETKQNQENELKAFMTPSQGQKSAANTPWDTIAAAQKKYAAFEREFALLDRGDAFSSELFAIARHLVRMADELPKPSKERLREYRDSGLESLKFQLLSPAPLYSPLERAKLTATLTFLAEILGGSSPLTAKILAGRNPAARADELVRTRLYQVEERKRYLDGGKAAIESSNDPMILLARLIDDEARKLRKRFEVEVEEPEREGYAAIAKIRFMTFGRNVAPDATFTLRIAFGTVRGYEVEGEKLAAQTTFGGAFAKAEAMGHKDPNKLPQRWHDNKAKLDLATPFNFTSTADTIGGNSGSPVLNRAGEVVGVNFDRNRHGLVRNFIYTDVQARHIAVHSRAVLEALQKLYGAPELVKELTAQQ